MFRPRLRKVRAEAGLRRDARARCRVGARLVVVSSPRRARRRRRGRRRSRTRPAARQRVPRAPGGGRGRPACRHRAARRAGRALRRQDRGGEGSRAPARGGTAAPGRPRRPRRPGRPPRDDGGRPGSAVRSRDGWSGPCPAGDAGPAVRPLPARGRVRPRVGRRELRPRGGGGGRGRDPRRRVRTGRASRRPSATGRRSSCPYDREATIAAIARVLDDEALRRRLGAGALRAARRKTWDAVVDAQVAIYEEALEPG